MARCRSAESRFVIPQRKVHCPALVDMVAFLGSKLDGAIVVLQGRLVVAHLIVHLSSGSVVGHTVGLQFDGAGQVGQEFAS